MRKVIVGGVRFKKRLRTTPAEVKFTRGEELGRGGEGIIYEGEATLSNGRGREHTIKVAFKYYNAWFSDEYALQRIIIPQHKMTEELRKVERKQKRGLHILPTYRFVMEKGEKPFVVKTLLPPEKSLTDEQRFQFRRDEEKQVKILEGYGFYEEYQHLSFHPYLFPNGKVIAVLNDIGNIVKMTKKQK